MENELNGSELGTKEYWDSAYQGELDTFNEDGDRGEVWFGIQSMKRIIKWLQQNVSKDKSILDIGCGNGVMLVELGKCGYKNLTGEDYSENAISLAKRVADSENVNVDYQCCDFLAQQTDEGLSMYDVCLDKGTYDAISLNPENSKSMRLAYKNNLLSRLKNEGLFVITSCNWTMKELEDYFSSNFKTVEVIPTPTFSFGGQSGNNVTSIVFKKNTDKC